MSFINQFKYGGSTLEKSISNAIFSKADFNILSSGKIVWFDNGATTQKPNCVINSITEYYQNFNSNIHRSPHNLSMISSEMFDSSRELTAQYLGCETDEIVFVKGATEGINFLANSLNYQKLICGAILISNTEHHSNIVPWQLISNQNKINLEYLFFNKEKNTLDLKVLENMLSTNPLIKVISICHVSNVTGICNPIEDICTIAHKYGAIVIVDGAQGIPHFRPDVKKMGCDAYVFSSHKLFGPTGVGVVYCNKNLYNYLKVWQGGGSMITDVQLYSSTFAKPPQKYEAGTPNIADIISFGETIKYLLKYDWSEVEAYERSLTEYMIKSLREIPNIKIISDTLENKVPIFSFVIEKIDDNNLLTILNNNNIAIRYGHHCAQPIVRYYGYENVYRASLAPYNDITDINKFISVLKTAVIQS